jgi:hypothetical protein
MGWHMPGTLVQSISQYINSPCYELCRSYSLRQPGPYLPRTAGASCPIHQKPGLKGRAEHYSPGSLLMHLPANWIGGSPD